VSAPLVLVMVGTDHHPFDRLVDWADEVAVRHPDLHVLVQYGASRAPAVAEGIAFLRHEELTALLGRAGAVLCHGGPGTIMDARDAGHVPLCVPRDPARGEHVDGHQQRFVSLVASTGVVRAITTTDQLALELGEVLQAPARPSRRVFAVDPVTALARERLAVELDELVLVRPGRLLRRRALS